MLSSAIKRTSDYFLIGFVMVLAGALRVYRASHELWLDEALSYHFVTTRSLSNLLFSLPLTDPHPPLYYIILHGWIQIAGTSEIALRMPSIVFGTISVGAFYYLVKIVFDRPTALLSALLMAISPFFIRYSQEVRMYALAVLLTVTATYFFYRATKTQSSLYYLEYIISAVLLGYTHVWGLLILWSHILYIGYLFSKGRNRNNIVAWFTTFASVGILLSPWVGSLLWRAFFESSDALNWLSPPSIRYLLLTPVMWVTGIGTHYSLILLVPVAIFAGLLWLISIIKPIDNQFKVWTSDISLLSSRSKYIVPSSNSTGIIFAFLLLVPLITGIVLSHLIKPMYHIRSTIMVAVGFYALLARGIILSQRVKLKSYIPGICALILVLGLISTLPVYYGESSQEPWKNSTNQIQHAADENDLILITDRYMQSIYAYYADNTSATVITIAEDPSRDNGVQPIYNSFALVA